MASVNILCPNGRRQVVKVTPNVTILQILEEVCLKRGFESARHDLKHGRNMLDITSTFRFSGIPNNGKLELVERNSPRSLVSEVTIALQLESERRQKTVTSNTTLCDMIKLFQLNNEDLLHLTKNQDLHPIVINMREEIIGLEALQHATLQSIGLVSGKVALRLVYRPVEQQALDRISAQINSEKQKMKKLKDKAEACSVPAPSPSPHTQSAAKPVEAEPMDTTAPSNPPPLLSAGILSAEPSNSSSHTTPSQTVVSDDVMPTNSASDSQPARVFTVSAVRPEVPRPAVRPEVTSPAVRPEVTRPAVRPPVSEFKFPESTAGQDLYRNEESDVQPSEYLPCDRELIVFSMLESRPLQHSSLNNEDLPDNFFEVTKDDLQKMIRHLREQASDDENALMTASMRQARLESNFSKYKSAIIRFHLPDKMVLQAKFNPRETVHSLTKFIQSHIRDQNQAFNLYTTPPKKVLNDSAMTLIQAQLVPMAVVYVGFHSNTEMGLCEDTLSLKRAKEDADNHAKQSLPVVTSSYNESHKRSEIESPRSVSTSASRANTAQNPSSTTDRPIPKWYKPSGK